MSLAPSKSGRFLTAATALLCLVACACVQSAPVTPLPAPPAAEAAPGPTPTSKIPPPSNQEPRTRPNLTSPIVMAPPPNSPFSVPPPPAGPEPVPNPGASLAASTAATDEIAAETAAAVKVLAADPGSPSALYAGTARGIYATTNASDSWAFCGGPLADDSISAVTFSSGSVFAGTAADGVFRSDDKGKTWRAINQGLASRTVTALVLDDAGAFGMNRLYAGTDGGVFRSSDGGLSWEPASAGLTDSAITAMASGAGAVYAGAQGGKLFKTTDGGRSWSEDGAVPWSGPVRAVVFENGQLLVASDSGLFRGARGIWSAADTGLPSLDLTALVVSSNGCVYVVIREGIWRRCNDSTGFWTLVSETSPSALAIGPDKSPTLYAGMSGTVLKSTDSGKSWKTIALKRSASP